MKNEYEFLSDYIKNKYDERDKYIKFFIGVLTALAYVIGKSIEKQIWEAGLIFSLLALIFSYFILMKILNQRIRATEYKNNLNMVRSRLWELSGKDEKTKLAILPIEESVKYLEISGGDIRMFRIIEAITAFSYAGSVFFAYKFSSPHIEYFSKCWGIIILILIIVSSVSVLEIKWRKLLKKEDKKFICKQMRPRVIPR